MMREDGSCLKGDNTCAYDLRAGDSKTTVATQHSKKAGMPVAGGMRKQEDNAVRKQFPYVQISTKT